MTIPDTMLAARLLRHGDADALDLSEVPVPSPAEGEVLVRVSATALNNTDLWTREGAYGLPGDPTALAGWRGKIEFPRVQGADIAGSVVTTGVSVDVGLRGARVLVDPAIYDSDDDDANPVGLLGSERDGGYAQYVTVRADRVHRVDDSPLSDAELACLPTAYGTALGMLERGNVRRGERVVVTGASGGVGLALVQLAAARGATVVAVSSSGKLSAVREAGADHVMDRNENAWDQITTTYAAAVDVVLDVVAGDVVKSGLSCLRDGGRWVVAGALDGHQVDLDVRRLYCTTSRSLAPACIRPLISVPWQRSGERGKYDRSSRPRTAWRRSTRRRPTSPLESTSGNSSSITCEPEPLRNVISPSADALWRTCREC